MSELKDYSTFTYEQAMEALETVVRKLDNGELPLEEAISSFQDGLEYIKVCQEKLYAAEGKLKLYRNGQFSDTELMSDR